MRTIDCNSLPCIPWKNGGGSTRTVAVSPEGAGFDDFDWRISIADVRESGDFSLFPGVDRTILLLEGSGMTLESGDSVHLLATPFEPWNLAADVPTKASLLNGSVRDFNVMVRRGRTESRVQVWRTKCSIGAPHDEATHGEALLYCAQGAFTGDVDLSEGWAVRAAAGTVVKVRPTMPDSVLIEVFVFQREERS